MRSDWPAAGRIRPATTRTEPARVASHPPGRSVAEEARSALTRREQRLSLHQSIHTESWCHKECREVTSWNWPKRVIIPAGVLQSIKTSDEGARPGERERRVRCGGQPNTLQVVPSGSLPSDARAPSSAHHARASRPVAGLVSNSGAVPRSHRSSWCAISSAAVVRKLHSQTVATRQPDWSRSRWLRRSRSVFSSNLACQNSRRVVGVVVYGQPAWRCQKQPCTKHTARNLLNTRSGVPGSRRSCRRYRSPQACTARRRSSSGRVFLLPIPAIMRERVARSTMSAIVVRVWILKEYHRQQTTRGIANVIRPNETLRRGTESVGDVNPRCGHARAADTGVGRAASFGTASYEGHA